MNLGSLGFLFLLHLSLISHLSFFLILFEFCQYQYFELFYYLLLISSMNLEKPKISVGSAVCKESACNAGYPGLMLGLGRSPGEGNDLPTPVFLSGDFSEQRLYDVGSQRVRHD